MLIYKVAPKWFKNSLPALRNLAGESKQRSTSGKKRGMFMTTEF